MAQPQFMQVKLSRFDAQPWGFRLQGGVDFAAPLLVQKVNGGSLAEQAGLLPGDAVIKINDVDVFNLRHKDAQDIVVRSGNNFVITIQRGASTWRPQVTPTGAMPQPQSSPYLQTVTKTSLAHKQQESQHIGCGYNNAARPFANGGDGGVKSIVNKQYNSPVGIYSDESIAETLSAQAEVLAGGVLGVNFKKNEKEYQADKSEVLKFLREEETGKSTPVFGNHPYHEPQQHHQPQQQQQQQHHQPQQQQQQHYQQQHHQQQQQQHHQQQQQHRHHQQQHHQQQQQQHQTTTTRHVSAPVNSPKPPSTGGLPTGQNICQECERLITGVFVRIKDKNLHVECFKCATCGTNLKNQGYYNFNNKLYCEIHAKLAALQNPPSGTEGYVPVPIKPNTKLSASTISSALSAHGFNGVSNGSSTAGPVNQGYARPFGSGGVSPAAAPKSPLSYQQQPQQQQWSAPQPKPAGSPYATLPRTSVGPQEPSNQTDQPPSTTLPRKPLDVDSPHAIVKQPSVVPPQHMDQTDDATTMLTESIGKINMGSKTTNFMAEAGKIISNMLEARLANNVSAPTNGSTALNHRPLNNNNTRSPMVIRKRLDLDDFKDLDPTEPVALHSVVAAPLILQHPKIAQKPQLQIPSDANKTFAVDLPGRHPMEKILGITTDSRVHGKVPTKPSPLMDRKPKPIVAPPSIKAADQTRPPTDDALPGVETVIRRINAEENQRNAGRSGDFSTQANDRRSYIEANGPNASAKDGPTFSVSVRALGGPNANANEPMSAENEEVVSQLLKDGKRPICCQCNSEITK